MTGLVGEGTDRGPEKVVEITKAGAIAWLRLDAFEEGYDEGVNEVLDWIESLKATASPISTAAVIEAAREKFLPAEPKRESASNE